MGAITVGSPLSSVDFDLGTWAANTNTLYPVSSSGAGLNKLNNENLVRLTLQGFADVEIRLEDPSGNMNLRVIHDANNNGFFDDNEEVSIALQRGANFKSASLKSLSPGAYYFYCYRIDTTIQTSFSFSCTAKIGAATIRSDVLRFDRSFSPIDKDLGTVSPQLGEWRPSSNIFAFTDSLSSLVALERLYSIRLPHITDLSVRIDILNPNVSINDVKSQIIRDANNNGVFDTADEIIPFSGNISLPNLSPGIYYIHVYRVSPTVDTGFTINVSSTVAPAPSGEKGATLANAIDLTVPVSSGNSMSMSQQIGFLSVNQKNQFYKVSFNQPGVFAASLLADNADMRLIQDKDNDKVTSFDEILSWKWARAGTNARIERFLNAGTYYLQISSYDNKTAQYAITTQFTPTTNNPQQFSITPKYNDGNFNSTAQATIQKAINFWQNAIFWLKPDSSRKRQIPQKFDIQFNLDSRLGDSGNGGSELNGNGDVVNAKINLGTPIVDRLNNGDQSNLGLVIHEIGHTFWLAPSLSSTVPFISKLFESISEYKADTYAGRVYGEILKRDGRPAKVPVQGGGHWAEDVFGDETMTPESNQEKDALSLLSLAALMDLDWNFEVNLSAAHPYALPQPGPRSALVFTERDSEQKLVFFDGGLVYLGANGNATNQVSAASPSRLYVINLAQPATISLSLAQSYTGQPATMRLIFDRNNNSKVDAGEEIASSQNSIQQRVSEAGKYYIEVYAGSQIDSAGNRRFGQSNYTLQFQINF